MHKLLTLESWYSHGVTSLGGTGVCGLEAGEAGRPSEGLALLAEWVRERNSA